MSDFVNEENVKSDNRPAYGDAIRKAAEMKVCPFCPEHLETFHKKSMRKHGRWIVTENMYPYPATKHHLLLIHVDHIEHVSELSPEAWNDLRDILQIESAERGIVGGAFAMRFGDTRFTGASVSHLHAHLVQSNPEDEAYDPKLGVRIRIG